MPSVNEEYVELICEQSVTAFLPQIINLSFVRLYLVLGHVS